MPPTRFGICVAGVSGALYAAGDAAVELPITSVARPFVFALVCETLGPEVAGSELGVNATGLPFNSLPAIAQGVEGGGPTRWSTRARSPRPTSFPGATYDARWRLLLDGLSRFAGRALRLDEEVYASASQTNHRNRATVRLLRDYGRISGDPDDAIVCRHVLSVMTTAGLYETSGDRLYRVGLPGRSGIGGGS